jgi:hypothetical protein
MAGIVEDEVADDDERVHGPVEDAATGHGVQPALVGF